MRKEIGFYVHIPYCLRKCSYCDFNSYPLDQGAESYLTALREEMKQYAEIIKKENRTVSTIYLGGGTPTCLTGKQLAYLFDYCFKLIPFKPGAEFTVEVNPGTIDVFKTKVLIQGGVNRISIGLQAWQNRLLERLGRIHSLSEFEQSYYLLREQGLKNISVDLMFALPGQSFEDWQESLHKLVQLKPEHISTYSLKLEQGTELLKLFQQGLVVLPSEDEEVKMYEYGLDFLNSSGYQQYEISNFCFPGYKSRHNLVYWLHQEYLGIGAGAHSYFNGVRYSNYNLIDDYLTCLKKKQLPIKNREPIGLQRKIEDTIILGLRLKHGVNLEKMAKETGKDLIVFYAERIERLKKQGLLEEESSWLRLTRKGLLLANQVFVEFIGD